MYFGDYFLFAANDAFFVCVIHHNKNYIFWVFMLGIVVMLYRKTFNHYNNLT